MSEEQPNNKATPKIDALELLLETFTPDDIAELASMCRDMCQHGFGDVSIHFKHGKFSAWAVTKTILPGKADPVSQKAASRSTGGQHRT